MAEQIQTYGGTTEQGVSLGNPVRVAAQSVYRYAIWIAIPIVCLLIGPGWGELPGLLGLAGLGAVRWIAFAGPLPKTRLNFPLLVLLVMTAISFRFSVTPELALAALCKILAGVLVLFVVVDYVHFGDELWNVASALVLVGVGVSYVSPFIVDWMREKVFTADFFYDRTWLLSPDPINPNVIAGVIAPIVPIAVALLFSQRRNIRILGAVALPPLFIILILLQSRGSFLALAAGLVVLAGLYRPKILPPLSILAVAGLALFLVFPSLVPNSLFAVNNSVSVADSLQYRYELWRLSLPLLAESPLLGIGLAAFPAYATARFPRMLGEVSFSHVHNLYYQVALDIGVIGAIGFVTMILIAIGLSWRAYRSGVERHLVIGLLAAWSVVVVHGVVDMLYWGTKPGIVLWVLLGLAAAVGNLVQKRPLPGIQKDLYGS